jgi:steroid 5-alpha reductase family enzyme
MTILELLGLNLSVAAVVMVAAWFAHLVFGKVSVVDSFWGIGFAGIAWTTFFLADGDPGRKWLIAVLVSAWALRLSGHLTRRNWGKPEDPRYAEMRDRNPLNFTLRSLFTIFLLQAAILWIVSLPVQLGMRPGAEAMTWLDWTGLALWCFGFFWEVMGDEQLHRFKSDPANRGKVLAFGLWRYTRHPNYFGESMMWWALFLVACSAQSGWLSFPGPLVLTLLLLKVSGISMTERKMRERHPDYEDYVRRTSAFLPRPPRRDA